MSDGGWIGLASLTITGVLATLTLWINKRHDAKTAALENQNAHQAQQITALTASQQECLDEHRSTQRKLHECESKHETMEIRVAQIEERLNQKKDRTDPD